MKDQFKLYVREGTVLGFYYYPNVFDKLEDALQAASVLFAEEGFCEIQIVNTTKKDFVTSFAQNEEAA